MKSWKTTLGGSLSSLGKTLMGIGIVPQLGTGEAKPILTYIAVTGFILSAVGGFFASLFAADKTSVQATVDQAIEVHSGHTDIIARK